MRNLIGIVFFLVWCLPAQAFLAPERPAEGVYIADTVDLITNTDEYEIKAIISKLDQDYRVPIIVVTIDSLLSYADGEYLGIEAYSKELFNFWGIGHAAHNYGVLVLISKNDRIARIQLGGGWGFLYDDHAQNIMDETLIPLFREGAFSQGIKQTVVKLDELARADLSFLINSQKITLAILLITLVNAVLFFVLITDIQNKSKTVTIFCGTATGAVYLVLYLIYSVNLLNHIEFLLTSAISLFFTMIFIGIYTAIYSKTHDATETIIATLKLLGLMVFGVIALLFSLLLVFGNRNEYGGGTADGGGGATGSWE